MRNLLRSVSLAILTTGFAVPAMAQTAPNGWTATEDGISKGTSKVTIGKVQVLDGQTTEQFLAGMETTPPEGSSFVSSGDTKDGKYVVQVKREITVDGTPSRSVLMLCKGGANENRLLEIFSENTKVIDLIIGAKYAISVCAK